MIQFNPKDSSGNNRFAWIRITLVITYPGKRENKTADAGNLCLVYIWTVILLDSGQCWLPAISVCKDITIPNRLLTQVIPTTPLTSESNAHHAKSVIISGSRAPQIVCLWFESLSLNKEFICKLNLRFLLGKRVREGPGDYA